MLENEIVICNLLAKTLNTRCVIAQAGNVICTLLPDDVPPGAVVLYSTI